MDKEKVYNEAVGGDEGFAAGDGYPSCDGGAVCQCDR